MGSVNTLHRISTLGNMLRLILRPSMRSILVNVSGAHGKVYSTV